MNLYIPTRISKSDLPMCCAQSQADKYYCLWGGPGISGLIWCSNWPLILPPRRVQCGHLYRLRYLGNHSVVFPTLRWNGSLQNIEKNNESLHSVDTWLQSNSWHPLEMLKNNMMLKSSDHSVFGANGRYKSKQAHESSLTSAMKPYRQLKTSWRFVILLTPAYKLSWHVQCPDVSRHIRKIQ